MRGGRDTLRELIDTVEYWWHEHWDRTWFKVLVLLAATALAWALLFATGFVSHVLDFSPATTSSASQTKTTKPKTSTFDRKTTEQGTDDKTADERAVKALRERVKKASDDMQRLLATKSGDDTIAILIRDVYTRTQTDGTNPLADTETALTNLIKIHASDTDGVTTKQAADQAVGKIDKAYDAWAEQVWAAAGQEVDALASQYAAARQTELFSANVPYDKLSTQCQTFRDDLDAPLAGSDAKKSFERYDAWRQRLKTEYKACVANMSDAMLDAAPPSNGQSQVREDTGKDAK